MVSTVLCCLQGFETRGTSISNRLIAWQNLLDAVSHAGPLTTNPMEAIRVGSHLNLAASTMAIDDNSETGDDPDDHRSTRRKRKKKPNTRKKAIEPQVLETVDKQVTRPIEVIRNSTATFKARNRRMIWSRSERNISSSWKIYEGHPSFMQDKKYPHKWIKVK